MPALKDINQAKKRVAAKGDPLVTLDQLKEIVTYDPETGFFFWVKTNRRGDVKRAGTVYSVMASGNKKYRRMRILYKIYLEHRLAFFWMTGRWPLLVDHIDGDGTNNRWANLREATSSQNSYNARRKVGASGYVGAIYDPARGTFKSQISVDGRHIFLGRYKTAEEASDAWAKAALKYHGDFARET